MFKMKYKNICVQQKKYLCCNKLMLKRRFFVEEILLKFASSDLIIFFVKISNFIDPISFIGGRATENSFICQLWFLIGELGAFNFSLLPFSYFLLFFFLYIYLFLCFLCAFVSLLSICFSSIFTFSLGNSFLHSILYFFFSSLLSLLTVGHSI
jgi:hypothetical protein